MIFFSSTSDSVMNWKEKNCMLLFLIEFSRTRIKAYVNILKEEFVNINGVTVKKIRIFRACANFTLFISAVWLNQILYFASESRNDFYI
jgi:hypothetical protein